jgi:DNA-binding transcriptional MerR regulator
MGNHSDNNTQNYKWGIREFAENFNVTPRTIRFYEDKGLLKPSRNSGARIFDHEDYVRFERIMRAKRIGFRLDDIKEVLDVTDGEITSRSELLKRKNNFEKAISSLKRRRKDIDVITNDLKDICLVITKNIESSYDSNGVFDLAAAYEARFKETMTDDYSVENSNQKEI